MKKTIGNFKAGLLWLFLILLCSSLKAQTLSPVVLSSSGGFYSTVGNSLSFTVAEMTMVQTFSQPSSILTQGFQQPEQLSTSIAENDVKRGEVMLYPNPTNGLINLSYKSNTEGAYSVSIFNMVGQIVFSQSYASGIGLNTIHLDIGQYRQGIYMLELSSTDLNNKKNSTIHKINLVY
jgi:hypothetical protein